MGQARAWDSTSVTAVGDGRYRATIGEEWVLAVAPQGGVVVATAARAMATELGTDQPLRSIHAVFASPVPAGEVEARVDVIRRGRSVSQVQGTLVGAGATSGLVAVGVYGDDRPGFADFTELTMPDVPDPADCPSFRDPWPPEAPARHFERPFPFWEHVIDGRPALGKAPWDPGPRESATAADWFTFEDPPVGDDGLLDPLSSLVLVDVMPGSVFQRIGWTGEPWFAPSVDLTVHLFGRATPGPMLAHSVAHRAGDGYASAEMRLWDPRAEGGPQLVAWATQQMFFTRM
jgi:acyl-CoA thioesterase